MFRADFDIHIEAPAGKVWDLVTRFDAFPSWTRWIAISGQLTLGGALDYKIFLRRRKGGARPFAIPADITELASGHRVAWATGPVPKSTDSKAGDLAYAALMLGPTALPGREIAIRLEAALAKGGI